MATLDGLARRLRASPAGLRLGSALVALYIRLVNATTRWTCEGRENFDRVLGEGAGVVLAMWHGRLFMSPYWGDPGRPSVGMISNNRDGDLIAGILARFGFTAVRGSSHDSVKGRDKGGLRAYIGARRELTRGRAVLGISPDGPRGPRMRAQPGVAQLSIDTGCPVQPATFSVRRGRVLKSWDRFLVPFPFGRGVQIWGEPLRPPPAGDPAAAAAYLEEIEAALTAITARADMLCGREPVAPAPAAPAAPQPAAT